MKYLEKNENWTTYSDKDKKKYKQETYDKMLGLMFLRGAQKTKSGN